MALLHLIVREVEQGCNIACTSRPQEWHKPKLRGKKIHQPNFIKNVIIHQAKGEFHTTPADLKKKNRADFDPRAIPYRRVKTLADFDLEKLRNITKGNCATLLYAPNETEEIGSSNTDLNLTLLTGIEGPNTVNNLRSVPTIAEEILTRSQGISLPEFQEALMESIRIDAQTLDSITIATVNQSASPLWFLLRKGRITASKVHECIHKVQKDGKISAKNNSLVGKILEYADPVQTKEMRHGLKMEKTCIKQYEQFQKRKHTDFKVLFTGLHISHEYPFIAASPDGMIQCSCPVDNTAGCCSHGKNGCLEVKHAFTSDTVDMGSKKVILPFNK